jgi:large subunit ribosomal protein L29
MKVKEIRALSAAEMDEKVVSLKEELFTSVFNMRPAN